MIAASSIAFWTSAMMVVYVYVGYPTLLCSGLLGRRRPIRRGVASPRVSVLVPAHNEERAIKAKLSDISALSYPQEYIEVLVGDDGSTDRTAEIVREHPGVKLYNGGIQSGKSCVENELVRASSGDILVFTDADCRISADSLTRIIENFADPHVGLVTVRPWYGNAGENSVTRNETLYMRYENWLQRQESSRGLLATASGSLLAVRRSLWSPLQSNIGEDFVLPLRVSLSGYRNVVESAAFVRTDLSQTGLSSMLAMKRRIISKDFFGLLLYRAALNPLKNGRIAVALWSHKLLRWLVPHFLLIAFVSNIFLLHSAFFCTTFAIQVAFYLLALAGSTKASRYIVSPFSVPASFCAVNAAALLAILQCALGRPSGHWKPVR